jgi:hypothetical protein
MLARRLIVEGAVRGGATGGVVGGDGDAATRRRRGDAAHGSAHSTACRCAARSGCHSV